MNKVLSLVVNDWFDPPKNLPAAKSPVERPFDQNGSYQRMNPMRSHDPENEASLLFIFRLRKRITIGE
ncbi:hypothetical protein BRARA_D00378 [Brassica rapa]|uniref:Uncharacterized protein n=1 Tax=Brassica campestris TaxID=3711 RepID=A0A397ZI62_BRACM|nr:hypothetical protein BRARA_D00378 [Brassica rapa]